MCPDRRVDRFALTIVRPDTAIGETDLASDGCFALRNADIDYAFGHVIAIGNRQMVVFGQAGNLLRIRSRGQ
ncbi:hypothetical protein D3C81_2009560 [compost metagenome]